MKTELTAPEQARLSKLERVISEHKVGFVMAADALSEIRDSKLYRSSHDTFEGYVREKWGWSRQHAYRLMEAGEVAKCNLQVTSQNQAIELSRVPEANRVEVMQAAASDGPVTARKIKEAAKTLTAAPEPAKVEPERSSPPNDPEPEHLHSTANYSAFVSALAKLGMAYEALEGDDRENARGMILTDTTLRRNNQTK